MCVVELLIFDIDTFMNTKYSEKCLVGKICQGSLVNKSSPHEIRMLGCQYQVPSPNVVLIDIKIEYLTRVWSVLHGSVIKTFLHH